MHFSKENRIKTFIVIDLAFFLLEIVVGYTTHSLALVADAFHMLNDVISLFVGLWAVRVATRRPSSSEYTYGWDRAELIGGLFNGVFLVALCLTIFLDAIERFINVPHVENPKLVLIVGGVGLAFNILGLFVFHQHDHGEGDHDHEHDHEHEHAHGDDMSNAEQGKVDHSHPHADAPGSDRRSTVAILDPRKPDATYGSLSTSHRRRVSVGTSLGRQRTLSDADGLATHPFGIRQKILNDARSPDPAMASEDSDSQDDAVAIDSVNERAPLLADKSNKATSRSKSRKSSHGRNVAGLGVDHGRHNHSTNKGTAKGGHGHSHADMNIRGMFLHVLGDALGNVGVMASALIIWLATDWKERFYVDPAISLLITVIILKSAIPLVKDTSKPLLQAVPSHISVDDIREDVERLPGIISCHHIHVWALTPSKLIATLDVQLDFNFEGRNASRYMDLAKEIKSCLHGHGIHSSTVQPEFCTNSRHNHAAPRAGDGQYSEETSSSSQGLGPRDPRVNADASRTSRGDSEGCGGGVCLLNCKESCTTGKQCCGPSGSGTNSPRDDDQDHTHR